MTAGGEQIVYCFLFAFFHKIAHPSHTIPTAVRKGMLMLGRRRGVMSDGLKEEIAKELGFYDVVQKEGWGGIRAKDAGNMVKRAIEIAQQNLLNK
ncbi:small, acid-soluble spore protein [Cytobacillus firmus]|nr:small, acid-soluble spore protein [Cytobacillus firmus]